MMVNCKFFLEGYCKFGESCRFEHIDSYNTGYVTSEDRPFGVSILKGSNSSTPVRTRQEYGGQDYSHVVNQSFQQHNYQQKSSKYNVQEIMEVVIKDLVQSEKGNQWQLSCYSPLKELPNLPGLEDHSAEELRYECYKASQNGSIPLWQAIVQQLYANAMKLNNEVKRKDTGYTIIDRWLRDVEDKNKQSNMTTPFESSHVSSSVFGRTNSASSSVFGGSNPSSSFLVSQNEHSSMFGSNEQTSGFGGNIASSFGGGNSFVSPGFGNSINISPLSNPFVSQTNNQPPTNSSFSFSLPQQQLSNTQTTPVSGFALGSNMGLTMSSFPQNTQPFPAGVTSVVDDQEYSKDEELTSEELGAFKADRFCFGSIPTKPPPRTFCNF